jgi:predicted TIM-barrel fold metal-dependent hydrolase
MHLLGGQSPSPDFPGAVAGALEAMDQAGIRKAVVLPMPQVHGTRSPFDAEDFVAAIRQHPSRFAFLGGGGSLNPMLHEAAARTTIADEPRRRFEERALALLRQGATGFGEITAHHVSLAAGHPYESVAADHPLLRLLADIAARHDVVIDLHLDVVTEDMSTPGWLAAGLNPAVLPANLRPFERLLEHNRQARIIWAHAGSDVLGHWTVDLSRRLLARHPNLYMSLRMTPGRVAANHPLTPAGAITPAWRRLLGDFPDRFVIGADQFIASPRVQGSGPGLMFAQVAPRVRERTRTFLEALPGDLARRIAHENATRLYRLRD